MRNPTSMTNRPILWSFRRCPYAMRARLGLLSAGVEYELREVVLRDKPQVFLDTSPSATVPCLSVNGTVLDESLDIMAWALRKNDPEALQDMPDVGHELISRCDGVFKTSLDHYKYPTRYEGVDAASARDDACSFIAALDAQLADRPWLFGPAPKLADLAILPFIRQFAHVDLNWWETTPYTGVQRWLQCFKSSDRFGAIMRKYPQWVEGDAGHSFPETAHAP